MGDIEEKIPGKNGLIRYDKFKLFSNKNKFLLASPRDYFIDD